jgi:hypothetical protein
MSAWSEYKKKIGETRPWDIVSGKKINEETAGLRLQICSSCDRFIKLTKQCRECGCIMTSKVKLQNASCPLQKW